MKTILWATLSANGNYATSSAEHPPKNEALMDFANQAKLSGNFISGRKTFEGFRASGADKAFAGLDIVVVSESRKDISGVKTVRSPREAIDYLKSKGHEIFLFTGGETLHNSILAENLVDEVIFNFAPVFECEGMNLVLPRGEYKEISLIEVRSLGSGVIQHRYAIQK